MYICDECGNVVCEHDLQTRKDFKPVEMSLHTDWCYETMTAPCECGGEFVKAKKCEICGEYIPEDGLDLCDNCIEKGETLENALKIGDENNISVEINGFLASMFEKDEIEEILTRELKRADVDFIKSSIREKVSNYLNEDVDSFVQFLKEEKEP